MATITVTNLSDSGPGSLRDTLSLANPGDTITFAPNLSGGTLVLTNGELDITKNLTINGDIDDNGTPDITIDAEHQSRVFDVPTIPFNHISATLNGLVMVNGYVGADDGGGIAVGQSDALTVSNSRLAHNSAGYSGVTSGGSGGAISVDLGGALTLLNTAIDHNSAQIVGGGIYDRSGSVNVFNSTISRNGARDGGGIYDGFGSVNVVNSTVSGNTAQDGGGAYVRFDTLTLVNATFSGNSAYAAGGGIFESFSTTAKLYDSTLTGNLSAQDGAIQSEFATSLTLSNSIVAGNNGPQHDDIYGRGTKIYFNGDNILGSSPAVQLGATIDTSQGTYTQIDGTSAAALATVFASVGYNPDTGVLSGVLAKNGGPVRTVAINPAGIAYNAGSNAALPPDTFDLNNNGNTVEPLPVDARGLPRVVGGTVDVGAFEQQPGANFVVTTLADNPYDGGTLAQELAEGNGLSLRQALGLANQDPTSADTITFDPNLINDNNGVLFLSNGPLTINGNVTIEGDILGEHTPDITIDGQGLSQDFVITGGKATLDGLTITGGYGHVDGAGVSLQTGAYAPADVTISHSVITNNRAGYGGGISIDSGDSLLLSNSVISGNSARYVGGGIANKGYLALLNTTVVGNNSAYIGGGIANKGVLTVINSTLSNDRIINSLHGSSYYGTGAGLYNAGAAALVNTTITGNRGAYAGGGLYNSGGLLLTNATIANNSATNGGGLYNAACGCGNAAIYDSTFTGNYAQQFGGGIHNAGGTVTLTNSLVAGNGTGYQGPDVETGPPATTNYAGVNLFSQAGVGRPGTDIVQPDLTQVFANLTTIDPDNVPNSGDEFAAGTLANNGGLVQTVAIKVGGSAQNAGSTADLPPDLFDLNNNGDTTEPLPVDARGEPRVFGSAVDIGAFEAQAPVAPYDFNADGQSDLLFQNTDATPQIWLMNGTSVISETSLPDPPVQWKIVGSGDFNGDGDADILWLNTISNQPSIWEMNGTSIISAVGLVAPPLSWRIAGIGDFYGTGDADILWQNTINGAVTLWEMNGTSIVNNTPLTTPPAGLKVVATGDFNGDGHADILFINTLTNAPTMWEMNGTSIVGQATLAAPPPQWEIVGTGDFNGDGDADILWLNTISNQASIWEMNGTSVVSAVGLVAPPSNWRLVGTSDVNGDGKADILWQNSNGTVSVWEMNGTSIALAVDVGTPGVSWILNNNDPPLPAATPPGASGTASGNGGTMHLSMPDGANGNVVLGPPTTGNGAGARPPTPGNGGFGSSLVWPGNPALGVPTGSGAGVASSPMIGGTTVASTMQLGIRSG